jgi:hypothetical protein
VAATPKVISERRKNRILGSRPGHLAKRLFCLARRQLSSRYK